jgi:hypothetical protein
LRTALQMAVVQGLCHPILKKEERRCSSLAVRLAGPTLHKDAAVWTFVCDRCGGSGIRGVSVSFRCLCLTAGMQAPSAVMEKPAELVMSPPSPTRLRWAEPPASSAFTVARATSRGHGCAARWQGAAESEQPTRRIAKLLPSGSRIAATRCGLARLEVMLGELERRDHTAPFAEPDALGVLQCCVLASA